MCLLLLERILQPTLRIKVKNGIEFYCPTLALAKCAAAISRRTDDPALAEELVSIVEDFPGINLISLGLTLARRAAETAIMRRLRGADAVYVAVAAAFDATLISWHDAR
jgi:predicted nucleic acid-binding protein